MDKTKVTMNGDDKKKLKETIFRETLDQLFKSLPSAVFATVFIAAVLVSVLWREVDINLLTNWFLIIGIINIIRLILYLAYNRRDTLSLKLRYWDFSFYFLLVLTGVCWSAVSVLLLPHNNSIYHYFPIMVLIGMSAGSVTSLSFSMRNILTYLCLVLLPLLINEILIGSFLSYSVAWLTIIFVIYTTINAKLFNRTIIENITLRYESEKNKKELIENKDAAIAANSAKNSFISMISHELRTPLNAILGYGQLLKLSESPGLDKEQAGQTQGIIDSGKHLLSLIEELLDLSRIEANKMKLSIEVVSLSDALNESLAILKPIARSDQIEIINNLPEEQLVKADYKRLKQIIINLLSNAIKYNKVNGSVTISAHIFDDEKIRLSVTDNGLGLSAVQQAGLFEHFQRFNDKREGIGLGLYITKKLVIMMEGDIGVESEVNKGSTFWFELPLYRAVS